MKFRLLESVVLLRDLPAEGLKAGEIGAVVEVYEPDGVEVEFVTAAGRTQAVVTLPESHLRPIEPTDRARRLPRSA